MIIKPRIIQLLICTGLLSATMGCATAQKLTGGDRHVDDSVNVAPAHIKAGPAPMVFPILTDDLQGV